MIQDHNLITEIQGIRPMLTINLARNEWGNLYNDNKSNKGSTILNELKVISIKRQMDEDDKSLFNDKDKDSDNINIIKSIEKKKFTR